MIQISKVHYACTSTRPTDNKINKKREHVFLHMKTLSQQSMASCDGIDASHGIVPITVRQASSVLPQICFHFLHCRQIFPFTSCFSSQISSLIFCRKIKTYG